MLSIIHKIVSIPFVYDFVQLLAGASKSHKILREEFSTLGPSGRVLDVGGGTGLSRTLLPEQWNYCCLDPDPQKLAGFRSKFPGDEFIEASGCDMPLPDNSFDLCIMVGVSHHLTDDELRMALAEIKRVLRPQGMFILMDSVWNPRNLRGRFLYAIDRGSFPKTRQTLEEQLGAQFVIDRKRFWKVHQEYALFWCH